MSDKNTIIKELLRILAEAQEVESMPYSTSKELISLVRELQCS